MRSFKKIAAMIMAVAMLCSFTALAATVTLNEIADVNSSTATVDFSYTSDASQNTILAYAGTALSGANVVYIDQIAKGATIPDIALDANGPFGTYTVAVGGTDVATAAATTFSYNDATPKYNVTLESAANGEVSYDVTNLDQVRKDSVINFTFKPYFGYEINSVVINDVPTPISDNTYALTVTGDVTIEPVFAKTENYQTAETYTYKQWFDVDASEDEGRSSTGETFASKIFFGKANGASDKTIKSMGMKVEKWDATANDGNGGFVGFTTSDDPETTYNESVGPYFAANPAKIAEDNKYGIRFYGFDQGGKYRITSYVEYDDGLAPVEGESIEFTVE